MTASDETLAGVRDAIVRTFALASGDAISRETTGADVAGWDSLSHSMLLMEIEERFDLELPLDRVYEASNVGELADLIEQERARS